MSRKTRTNDEIEALLREQGEDEIRASGGRVSRSVIARLRSDPELRMQGHAGRIGAIFDDDGHVPRWFLAAAALAIMALGGWFLFGPSGATSTAPVNSPDITASNDAPTLPDPAIFDVAAKRLLAMAVNPRREMLRREARAIVGAGWELAGRVLNGIPVELVKPMGDQRGAG